MEKDKAIGKYMFEVHCGLIPAVASFKMHSITSFHAEVRVL